jgi:hypothetical protein
MWPRQRRSFYTPDQGALAPIYNGSSFIPTEFTELSLSLAASHTLNTIYDVFVFSNSGVLTLVTGPAWLNSAPGLGARGSGGSTTRLTRIKGFKVNAVSIACRDGATTHNIGANLATYLGWIYIDATAGQVTCHRSYGQSRKWGIWNAFNRRRLYLKAGDSTATWVVAGTSFGPAIRQQSHNFPRSCRRILRSAQHGIRDWQC